MRNVKINELQQLKKEFKLTYSDIASMAGLPLSTVQKVLGGKIKSPRPATLEAIEDALHKSNPVIGNHREISIGNQDFASIIENNYFYIDKISFIKEWWDKGDVVTLITRPRRFGKTLNLSMVNYFFSNKYQDGKRWFENLDIWKNKEYHALLGKYPVIFISFPTLLKSNHIYLAATDNEKIYVDVEKIFPHFTRGWFILYLISELGIVN